MKVYYEKIIIYYNGILFLIRHIKFFVGEKKKYEFGLKII